MAAVITVVISAPQGSITDFNSKLPMTSAEKNKIVNALIDLLTGAVSPGTVVAGSIQVTTRDTAPSISTSGTGSLQTTVNVG